MDRIYDDAKDIHVRAICIYGKSGDTNAYIDLECTEKFKTSELKEAFVKGSVIVIGNDIYSPVNFGVKSSVGTITYVTADKTTATTAVLATLSAVKD